MQYPVTRLYNRQYGMYISICYDIILHASLNISSDVLCDPVSSVSVISLVRDMNAIIVSWRIQRSCYSQYNSH